MGIYNGFITKFSGEIDMDIKKIESPNAGEMKLQNAMDKMGQLCDEMRDVIKDYGDEIAFLCVSKFGDGSVPVGYNVASYAVDNKDLVDGFVSMFRRFPDLVSIVREALAVHTLSVSKNAEFNIEIVPLNKKDCDEKRGY